MAYMNSHLYETGKFKLENWAALGFLTCCHQDRQSQKDDFWQLVNPDLDDMISIEAVVELLKTFIALSIDMRIEIEEKNE